MLYLKYPVIYLELKFNIYVYMYTKIITSNAAKKIMKQFFFISNVL